MGSKEVNVVTGAFSFTGRYIAARLLAQGKTVRTLTRHPHRIHPFGDRVSASVLDFADPKHLVASMRDASTLYNTYWIRYEYGRVTFDEAVKNTGILISAARAAGVKKIIQISVANASSDSTVPFYRGKGLQEEVVIASGLPYGIVRPTLIYGQEDILVNNVAWFLRKFRAFGVPGSGNYRVQPVHVDDVAEAAVNTADGKDNRTRDIVGPEILAFNDFVRVIGDSIGCKVRISHSRPAMAYAFSRAIGYALRDVIMTWDEMQGLMGSLLVSKYRPTGKTVFSKWIAEHAATLGRRYTSGRKRYFRGLAKGLSDTLVHSQR